MSVYYQNIHEYLQEVQANQAAARGIPPSPNVRFAPHYAASSTPGSLTEMHEFISAGEAADASNQPQPQLYNPYAPPPPRTGLFPLTDFLQDPLNAGLTTLTKVAQIARSPTQIINTAASGASAAYHMLHQNHIFTKPPGHAERVYPGTGAGPGTVHDPFNIVEDDGIPLPPPVLPLINCTVPQNRLEPLKAADLAGKTWTKDELCVRIFKGGIAEDNALRARLWPIILGLEEATDLQSDGIPLEEYHFDWTKREALYKHYRNQWESILPEQERRFSLFRERKSLIERDVIRCDRTHPYYTGSENESLEALRSLLLTYMMYDFDTGYVQGMSDLASPVLYVAEGDVGKAFWFFTQMMEFTHNNFEMSQSTIKLQLDMLWKLIELTDPIFAQYLANNESINCYFAFRWIVCQFKREFMKTNSDDYGDILQLWESIWTCSAMRRHLTKLREEQKVKAAAAGEAEAAKTEVPPLPASPQSTSSVPSAPSPESSSFNSISLKELTALEAERESAELVSAMEASLKLEEVETATTSTSAIYPKLDSASSEEGEDTTGATGAASETKATTASEDGETSSRPSVVATSVNLNVYVPEVKRLSDTELYVLCICLCIIRRERDWIMANRYDATEILKHFNTLQLNANLKDILQHAATIWSWLVYDEKEELLYTRTSCSSSASVSSLVGQMGGGGGAGTTGSAGSTVAQQGSTAGSSTRNEADDFDLLPDAKMPGISGEDYFLMNS